MKILIAPAHYNINNTSGSEYTRSYEYIKALSEDHTISGDAIVGYSQYTTIGRIRIHSLYSRDPVFISNYHRLLFPFQIFIKSLYLLSKNKYDCIWHISPFDINATFSLLALWNKKRIRFVVGPIYTPFEYHKYPKLNPNSRGISKSQIKRIAMQMDSLVYRYFASFFKKISTATLKYANKIIVVESAGKKMIDKSNVKNVEILPLGVIEDKFTVKPRSLPRGPIKLITINVLVNRKRTIDVINAMDILVHKYRLTNINLTIVGGGHQETVLKNKSSELNLNNHINFVGQIPRTKLHPLYKNSDIFVSASVLESTPGVYFEAMAASLPMVLAENYTSIDLKKDKFGGFVVEGCNPDKLADAISKIITNKELYQQLSKKNYQLINTKYNFHNNMSRLKNILYD